MNLCKYPRTQTRPKQCPFKGRYYFYKNPVYYKNAKANFFAKEAKEGTVGIGLRLKFLIFFKEFEPYSPLIGSLFFRLYFLPKKKFLSVS